MKHKLLLFFGLLLFFYGCPRKQEYARPDIPVPSNWPEKNVVQAGAVRAPAAADIGWKEYFTDPNLQKVIELALNNNRDMRMAAIHVERVQEYYRIQRAEAFPHINAVVNGEGYRMPAGMSSDKEASTVAVYKVGAMASSWELDLFGRIRSLKSRALEQFLATEQVRSATQIALVAGIAQSYMALAADRENLKLAQATLEAQQAYYELIEKTRDAGMASDLDLRQVQTQVDAARVDIARYNGQIALDENALNLLVGAPVAADLLSDSLGGVAELKDVRPGLPSDVLLRRPDILAAEHQLKAAYANMEAARANYFPRISLTAGLGITHSDLSDLFRWGARTWTFAPQAVLPIFDAGARRANYRISQADRDLAVAEYEKSIQSAFREVSDALSLRTTLANQMEAQQSLVKNLEQTWHLSDVRYKEGIDSYLGVLVAQRSLYAAQQGLLGVRLARMANLVTLYKVTGGGAFADSSTVPASGGTLPSGSIPVPTKKEGK